MPTENRSSNTEMVSELLPCPFCGKMDFLIERLDSDGSVVICQGLTGPHEACLARGPVGVAQDEGEEQPGRDKAVELWNARADQHQGEPVAYADPRSFENLKSFGRLGGIYLHEWMWAEPEPGMVPLYTRPAQGEPVGEVVAFGKGLHEIAWAAGRMPRLGAKLYTNADPNVRWEAVAGEQMRVIEQLKSELGEAKSEYDRSANKVAAMEAQLAERDGPHPIRVLGQEAYSTLVGMVEYCLNQRVCMGMDEGFQSFDPEEEHDFVKELRTFVALSAGAEPLAWTVSIPEGYCIMPRQLTAENGAKALLLGEFKLDVTRECPECLELEEPAEGCEICDGEGEYSQRHMIPWDKIKFIYSEAVKGLAIQPNLAR